MNIFVKPTSFLMGSVQLPGSKSYSIRAFLIAHCSPSATIINPSNCEDALVAQRVIEQLGSRLRNIKKGVIEVKPASKKSNFFSINVGESGTVLRLLLPLASLKNEHVKITGQGTLKGRPNHHLIATLRAMGKNIAGTGAKHSIPITIKGGQLKGGRFSIDGSLSSQFISALLITCPQLKDDSTIILKGKKLVSSDYITMTIQVLKECGVIIKKVSEREIFIKGRQTFKALKNFEVPADHGLAAFLMAAGCLVNSDIYLKGALKKNFVQADGAIFGFFRKMGARIHMNAHGISIKGPFVLKGGTFSLRNCPDLVPIMAIMALFAKGKTTLKDIAHARAKESDRISDLRQELLKIGADIRETKDTLTIHPQSAYKQNVRLYPHHDHRLAMAFCVLGLKVGAIVHDVECTHKSYPDFRRDLKSVGGRVAVAQNRH